MEPGADLRRLFHRLFHAAHLDLLVVHQIPHMVEGMGLSPERAAANVAVLVAVTMASQMVGG